MMQKNDEEEKFNALTKKKSFYEVMTYNVPYVFIK